MMRTLGRWTPAIGYAAIIVALSSSSRPLPVELPFSGLDKLLHVIEYIPFTLLVCWPLSTLTTPALIVRHADSAAVAAVGLFGLTDELHQSFVPGRSPDPLDVLADCTGALIGVALWRWTLQRHRRRRESHVA